jgi:NAD(P)-dependent dehydrogenase (short-subunit alcohol dehydrogenase family)
MNGLTGKVAIVTGASSGIGYATAKLFAHEGASVVVGARRRAELDSLVAEISESGGRAIAVAGDVQNEAYATELVDTAVRRFGGLDVAFNNAGALGATGDTLSISLSDWEETIRTNLTSAFLGAKYQLPAMLARGRGSLIFTSTFVGYTVGMPGLAAYAASKAALIGLTKALAAEFGARGIRVNALLPGGTDTPAGRAFANTPETLAFVRNLHALKRIASPDEIAQSALYLASDASSFTTGTALLADGGVSISRT